MIKDHKASTADLFKVLRRHFSRPVAEVGAEVLFWSQYGQHKLHGRAGIFKEDAELVEAMGKSASAIRRALRPICEKPCEGRPEVTLHRRSWPQATPAKRTGAVAISKAARR